MILVLASIADSAAVSFASELGGSASVLTCNDLIRGPIRLFHPEFEASSIAVGAEVISVREISAVLNLLPTVMANELTIYPPEERPYQAAELRALLLYLLTALPCLVVNRATPLNLTGPVLNPAAWLAVAEAAGIPLARMEADTRGHSFAGAAGSIEATCVAGRAIAPSETAADEYTIELARRTHLEYLRARYLLQDSRICFLGADSYPDIRDSRTRAALRDRLLRSAE